MKRSDFIKMNALAVMGLRSFSFQDFQKKTYKAFLTGKNNPYLTDDNLLHKTAFKAFTNMQQAAEKDNISVRIVSGFRSFDYQLSIWNRKYRYFKKYGLSGQAIVEKITTYSAIPGTSRHHWGTEIDIIDANARKPESNILQAQHFHDLGNYCELNEWMQNNAHTYGFYQVYTNSKERTGFAYEPWHYSYQPLSKAYLKAYAEINLEGIFKHENILGKKYLDKNCLMSYSRSHIYGINPKLI